MLGRYEQAVDLLVIGAHVSRPIDHLLGASISQQLVDDPSVPLLVLAVRHIAAAAEALSRERRWLSTRPA